MVTAPLMLAVEVLSPATRSKDLLLKRGLYEDSGVASYWVIDLDVPSITAWELRDGRYADAGYAEGDQALRLELPFPVTVAPSGLR